MQCCGYAITDFSGYRLNMAYELGLLDILRKPTALLTKSRHTLDKTFSNFRGIDPISHGMDGEKLIIDLTDWIESNWGDAKRSVKKRPIIKAWNLLKQRFQDPNLDYNYKKINLFYQELEDYLEELM